MHSHLENTDSRKRQCPSGGGLGETRSDRRKNEKGVGVGGGRGAKRIPAAIHSNAVGISCEGSGLGRETKRQSNFRETSWPEDDNEASIACIESNH